MKQFKSSEERVFFFIHIIDQMLLHIKQVHLSAQTHMPTSVIESVFSNHFSLIVLHNLHCYICDPCYIHNSVITTAAKGLSQQIVMYVSL